MKKGVSCLCLTYGRPSLLEEAIESFLRQQWDGPKELIVLNDHPDQELRYSREEVRVFNVKWRLPTLGDKRNLSVALARYDHLLIWDDDDIHLPWRIEETMKALADSEYFKGAQMWSWNRGGLCLYTLPVPEWLHGISGYSRRIYEELGGYSRINGGEDLDFERRLRANQRVSKFWKLTQLPLERLYYLYRWAHGHYHATDCTDLSRIAPEVKPGPYYLEPHWKKDYCQEIKQQIQALAATTNSP